MGYDWWPWVTCNYAKTECGLSTRPTSGYNVARVVVTLKDAMKSNAVVTGTNTWLASVRGNQKVDSFGSINSCLHDTHSRRNNRRQTCLCRPKHKVDAVMLKVLSAI